MKDKLNFYIDGSWVGSESKERIEVINPETEELIGHITSGTKDDINKAVKNAADNELNGILEYSEVPLVSTDILNNPHSSIYDASSTQLLEGNHVKVVCWYDNEWGYSNRVVDLIGNLLDNELKIPSCTIGYWKLCNI